MATRVLFAGIPAGAGRFASYAGVGYGTSATVLGIAEPVVIAAAGNFVSDPILVSGLTGFFCVFTPTGAGGTTTFSIQHCDPFSQVSLIERQIQAGIAPGSSQGFTFGAYATGGPASADVFHTLRLKWAAVTAQQSISGIVLFAHAR